MSTSRRTSEQLEGAYASERGRIAHLDHARRALAVDEIRVGVVAGWDDAGTAARAVDLLGREMRRVAGAWDAAYERSGQVLDETVFARPDWMLEMLDERRPPATSVRAPLLLRNAGACPLVVVSEPRELMWAALAEWPALTAAVAMAALGWTAHVEVVTDCDLGYDPDGPVEEQSRCLSAAAVAPPPDADGRSFVLSPPTPRQYATIRVGASSDVLHLVVHRFTAAGQDLVRVSTRDHP